MSVSVQVIVWLLSVLGVVVVALTRVRLGTEDSLGRKKVSSLTLNVHTGAGVVAAATWFSFLLSGTANLGAVALLLWWVTTLAGLGLLLRWLPSHGRHADTGDEDDWAEGPGLSLLAHVGMLVGVLVFTWAFATGVV